MARKLTEERAAEHGITPTGHNGPSHDDIRIAANELVALNEERAQLNAKISSKRKSWKAQGITLGVLDAMVRMLEWSPEEVKAHFAERQWYAEALRYPIGTQLEFFGTEATPDAVKEQLKWKNIGVRDGIAGKGWANQAPDGCPPDCVKSYGEGWEEGQGMTRRAFSERQKGLQPVAQDPVEADAGNDDEPAQAAA